MATVKETVKFDGRLVTIFDHNDLEWEGYAPNEGFEDVEDMEVLSIRVRNEGEDDEWVEVIACYENDDDDEDLEGL